MGVTLSMMRELKFIPIIVVILGVVLRLVPHPANVAPITAIALFGGVVLPRKFGFILPIVAVFISDWFIGFYGFTMIFVYGSYIISGLIGVYLRKSPSLVKGILGTFLASFGFFVVSNFGVWADPRSFYSHDFGGLIDCYFAAIPFFRNTIIGDLFYAGLFFGGYYVICITLRKVLPSKVYRVLG